MVEPDDDVDLGEQSLVGLGHDDGMGRSKNSTLSINETKNTKFCKMQLSINEAKNTTYSEIQLSYFI